MNRLYSHVSIVLAFITILSFNAGAQIVINEGSNRNFQTVIDEDGEAEDWIELYNSGNEAVDLFGYQLTTELENEEEEEAWTFPNYTLQPGEHLLVFCSEKNRFPILRRSRFRTPDKLLKINIFCLLLFAALLRGLLVLF